MLSYTLSRKSCGNRVKLLKSEFGVANARKILVVVDSSVVANKLIFGHLLLNLSGNQLRIRMHSSNEENLGAVKIRRKHNHRVGQHIRSIGRSKYTVLRMAFAVSLSKLLHQPIDFLGFSGQSETSEEEAK